MDKSINFTKEELETFKIIIGRMSILSSNNKKLSFSVYMIK